MSVERGGTTSSEDEEDAKHQQQLHQPEVGEKQMEKAEHGPKVDDAINEAAMYGTPESLKGEGNDIMETPEQLNMNYRERDDRDIMESEESPIIPAIPREVPEPESLLQDTDEFLRIDPSIRALLTIIPEDSQESPIKLRRIDEENCAEISNLCAKYLF
jgi:hypothetical protein